MGLRVSLGNAPFLEISEVVDFLVIVFDIVVETDCLELLIHGIGVVLIDLVVEFNRECLYFLFGI
jgi:hypothetical protein